MKKKRGRKLEMPLLKRPVGRPLKPMSPKILDDPENIFMRTPPPTEFRTDERD